MRRRRTSSSPRRPRRRTSTTSISTARPRSSGKAIPHSARPLPAPTAFPAAARGARLSTRRSLPACGCGAAPSCGSTPRSTRVSAWRMFTASAGFPSGEAFKLGATYPYARVQRYFVRQTIDLGGETAEGRRRHQSVRRHADRKPPGADGRQIHRRRHLRHQQIRQQSQERFPELVADQCRQLRLCERRLGLQLWRRRRMVPGPLYAARRRVRSDGDPGRRGQSVRRRSRPDLQAVPAGRGNRGTARTLGRARQAQDHRLSQPRRRRASSPTRLRSRKRPACPPTSTRCAAM